MVLMPATGGCEGPQPSRPPSIIVATNRWALLAESLEGVRSVGAGKMVWLSARPQPINVATNPWPLLADALELEGVRSVGAGKTVWLSANRGCEGPQALQASTDHRCDEPMAIVGRSLELEGARSVGAGKWCGYQRTAARGTADVQEPVLKAAERQILTRAQRPSLPDKLDGLLPAPVGRICTSQVN
jgi:hypothetical protein